jgi:hypothetical protein
MAVYAYRCADLGVHEVARALIDRTERSASEPAVVSAPPSRRTTPRATDPRLAKLPRP